MGRPAKDAFGAIEKSDICASGRCSPIAASRGHLVLVSCADAGRLDLLLRAAERHLGANWNAALLQPVATRSLPAGGGLVVKPSGFDELDQLGALTMTWKVGRQLYGYPVSILARLATGENVVAGIPQELEVSVRSVWPHLSVIRLTSGMEMLREGLSTHASFSRAAGGKASSSQVHRMHPESFDVRVDDCADVGLAIRRLAAAVAQRLIAVEVDDGGMDFARGRRAATDAHPIPALSAGTTTAGKRGVTAIAAALGEAIPAAGFSPT